MIATPASAERVQKCVFNFEIYHFLKKRPIYPILPYWHDSALVPYRVGGMGVYTKEDRLSIGLTVQRYKPLKSVTTAGRLAAHTQDFPFFSV